MEISDVHFEVEDDQLEQFDSVSDGGVQSEVTDQQPDTEGQAGGPEAQQSDLRNYQLARDRTRRENVRPPARYRDNEMLFYALHIAMDSGYEGRN